MRVAVKWLKSPRHVYGIPRSSGTFSSIEFSLAEKIFADDPNFFYSPEFEAEKKKPKEEPKVEKQVEVKDTLADEPKTRPVKREKKG